MASDLLRRWWSPVCAVLLTLLGVVVIAGSASARSAAKTRYVAKSGHDTDNLCLHKSHPCRHIQHAVFMAVDGDAVSIGPGTYHESVVVSHKVIDLVGAGAHKTTIDGEAVGHNVKGPGIWIDQTVDVDRQQDARVEYHPPTMVIRNLAVHGNNRVPNHRGWHDSHDIGIAIGGSVIAIVENVVVSHHSVSGITAGGNPGYPSTLIVRNSTISRNNRFGIRGADSVTITNSTVFHNGFAGIELEAADATIGNSTVAGNVPGIQDRSFMGRGGCGICTLDSAVAVRTSTVAGNSWQGILVLNGSANVHNSTISGTVRPDGDEVPSRPDAYPYAGVVAARSTATEDPATLRLTGSIVAANTTLDDCAAQDATVVDHGYNLDSDGTCGLTANGSISNGKAKLGLLTDNGGPTQTIRPAQHSDAINRIPARHAHCSKKFDDQRGVSRPQGRRCDIGAVELRQR
jgi:hypothetical protein